MLTKCLTEKIVSRETKSIPQVLLAYLLGVGENIWDIVVCMGIGCGRVIKEGEVKELGRESSGKCILDMKEILVFLRRTMGGQDERYLIN